MRNNYNLNIASKEEMVDVIISVMIGIPPKYVMPSSVHSGQPAAVARKADTFHVRSRPHGPRWKPKFILDDSTEE